jgi:hypothetical protein
MVKYAGMALPQHSLWLLLAVVMVSVSHFKSMPGSSMHRCRACGISYSMCDSVTSARPCPARLHRLCMSEPDMQTM